MVHDTGRGSQDDVTELTGGKELDDPLLDIAELDVVAGRDDTGLVDAAVKLDNDLAVAVVVDLLELANVAWWKRQFRQESICCAKLNIGHHGRVPRMCKFSAVDIPDT